MACTSVVVSYPLRLTLATKLIGLWKLRIGSRPPLRSPALHQVSRGRVPVRELKAETGFQQPPGNDSPALEDELAFGAQDESADLQHPVRGRQPDWGSKRMAHGGHEFAIGQRVGRGNVDGAIEIRMRDEEIDRLREVGVVDP